MDEILFECNRLPKNVGNKFPKFMAAILSDLEDNLTDYLVQCST